jgi:release factor glutamine methyltransferase
MVYFPREDSFIMLEELLKVIKKYKPRYVLDVGTGSGILALEAAKYCFVDAVDIDKESLSYVKEKIEREGTKNIRVFYSDLFSNVKRKYNLIVFNPPYLPYNDANEEFNKEIFYKENIIKKFLEDAKKFLNRKGKILFCFSSFSNKKEIDKILRELGYRFVLLRKEKFFFEDFFVYLAWAKG